MKLFSKKLFSWELPIIVGNATQDKFAGSTCKKQVLPKKTEGYRLCLEKFPQVKIIESALQLLI